MSLNFSALCMHSVLKGWRAPFALVLALTACSTQSVGHDTQPPAAQTAAVSTNNRTKFKGGQRYAAFLAEGLGLARTELCKELSTYDCADVVHKIALGGIEPYRQTIYQPLKDRSVSSANAVDRIALSACDARASKDFAVGATPVLFSELVTNPAAASNDALEAVIKRIYLKIMRRSASTDELAGLRDFYKDVKAAEGANANRRFAALSCFIVATSEEALFY